MKLPMFCLCFLLLSCQATSVANAPSTTQTGAGNQSAAETEADQLHVQVLALYKEGKFQEALPLAKRAFELREKTLGPENVATLASLHNLAVIQSALGTHAEAANIYQRLLKAQEKLEGANSPKLVATLDKLGLEHLSNNKPGAAEEVFNRQLRIQEPLAARSSLPWRLC